MRGLLFVGTLLMCASLAAQRPELVVQSGHLSDINDLAFSPDGRLMATCGDDLTIKIWDLKSEKLVRSISTNSEMHAVWFTPINRKTGQSTSVIAAGIEDSLYAFTQYGIATGKSGFSSLRSGAHVTGLAYADDWASFAFALSNSIFLGDTLDSTDLVEISHQDLTDKRWTAVTFAHRHDWLAGATFGLGDNHIVIWDVGGEPRILMDLPLVWEVLDLTFTSDDRYLLLEAAYGEDRGVGIIEVAAQETVRSWAGRDLAYSEQHNDLLFCDDEGVQVFDLDSMNFDQTWTFGLGVPSGLAVSPDGKTFAVSWGNEVYLDDYSTGEVIRQLFGSRQLSSFTLFNPQGDKLIFNSIGGYLNIWNGKTGRLERMLEHDD
jgi:WD40 repeat protein